MSVVLDGQFSAVRKLLSNMTDDKILFWAAETTLQLYMAESSEQIRDLYITAYSLPKTSDIIRRSIAEKMSEYFLPYNPGYQEKDFYEMEIATGGIIRGFMSVPCDMYFTMDTKVARYLETSFRVYKVPQEKTQEAIQFVSRFDFAQIAQNVIDSLLSMLAEEICQEEREVRRPCTCIPICRICRITVGFFCAGLRRPRLLCGKRNPRFPSPAAPAKS